MKTQELIERQQAIIEGLYICGGKTDVMQYLSLIGEDLPTFDIPEQYTIAGCLSRTYFRAYIDNEHLFQIEGASQSVIMRGVIQIMRECFCNYSPEEVHAAGVFWVRDSRLLDMLTPQRQAAIKQMIERINRVCEV